MRGAYTIGLLILSNVFMTVAWYGHLRFKDHPTLAKLGLFGSIVLSWGIAFFEYCLMVPANRFGYERFDLPQLKVIQEVVNLTVFAIFAVLYMRERLTTDHALAATCLIGAVYFTFRGG